MKTSPFPEAFETSDGFVVSMEESAGAKGSAQIELITGEIRLAELHWYEAHGIGKKEIKVKRLLD